MKPYSSIIFLIFAAALCSCNFNINDIPGRQVSWSIKSSRKHGAFICAFRVPGDTINGIKIYEIFGERKYELGSGIFGRFTINCCESQLVITSTDFNYVTLNGVPQNWEMIGFDPVHSDILAKEYQTINFPDSLVIKIRPNVKDSNNVKAVTLYKIKNDK